MSEDQRRLTFVRDNVEHLAEEKHNLESLLTSLQLGSEEDSQEILRRLRSGTDHNQLAQQVHAGQALADVRSEGHLASSSRPPSRVESYQRVISSIKGAHNQNEIDEIVRRIRKGDDVTNIVQAVNAGSLVQPLPISLVASESTPGIEAEYSSQSHRFGLMKGTAQSIENDDPDASTSISFQPWTDVTNDMDFIDHLLSLYFIWQHCFFQSLPEHLFRRDYQTFKTKYCSRLLVNALCAAGCQLSDRPEARRDPRDPRTAGMNFFDEAVRLLNEDPVSTIPTTAALYLLCHIEGQRGRLSALWDYSGRCGRMALDLNLHLRNDRKSGESISDDAYIAESARCHVFWGIFMADQVTSFTLGRLPQIPVSAITVDLPKIDQDDDLSSWEFYDKSDVVPRPSAKSTTFHELAGLSKIVNSTLQMFFAPSQIISGSILLEEYEKYLNWFNRLPNLVSKTDGAPPHVLCLHMYYHAAVLLLFRPFLKAEFTKSDISPRNMCRTAANTISDLFAQHKMLYGLASLYTFQLHCLLTACTIHIINLPTIASTKRLATACESFQGLVQRNEWASGSINILKGLVQKWKIILPKEVEQELFRNSETLSDFDFFTHEAFNPSLYNPGQSGGQAEIMRPEKRGPGPYLNPSTQVMQKRQRLEPRETREAPINYLFAPFPNQPAPLLGPIHTSTSADTEWNDELSKVAQGFDGLDFSDDRLLDPFMGYQGEWGSLPFGPSASGPYPGPSSALGPGPYTGAMAEADGSLPPMQQMQDHHMQPPGA
ncbi:hypothetical protein LTS18_014268 [Coniosporium uncinatum]|uniref:Uncharacterized protein n=1 Tax=Coniosporium uncinatum TaxID=93489 RepID=A0ACC3DV82_9PEZI|nr:hypothetical protein LTS18_014268 [Coniosporium uncinatum]